MAPFAQPWLLLLLPFVALTPNPLPVVIVQHLLKLYSVRDDRWSRRRFAVRAGVDVARDDQWRAALGHRHIEIDQLLRHEAFVGGSRLRSGGLDQAPGESKLSDVDRRKQYPIVNRHDGPPRDL
jgi:hypothetical protein